MAKVSSSKKYFSTEKSAKIQAEKYGRKVYKITSSNWYVGTDAEISKLKSRINKQWSTATKKDASIKAKKPFKMSNTHGDVGISKSYKTKKGEKIGTV